MEPEPSAHGRLGCPKRMVFGPCGGVRDDERCELAEHRCVFLDPPVMSWPVVSTGPVTAPPAGDDLAAPLGLSVPSVAPFDPASVRRVVGVLGPVSDGLL